MGDLFRYLGEHASADYRAVPEAFADGTRRAFAARDAAFKDVVEGMARGPQNVHTILLEDK